MSRKISSGPGIQKREEFNAVLLLSLWTGLFQGEALIMGDEGYPP